MTSEKDDFAKVFTEKRTRSGPPRGGEGGDNDPGTHELERGPIEIRPKKQSKFRRRPFFFFEITWFRPGAHHIIFELERGPIQFEGANPCLSCLRAHVRLSAPLNPMIDIICILIFFWCHKSSKSRVANGSEWNELNRIFANKGNSAPRFRAPLYHLK